MNISHKPPGHVVIFGGAGFVGRNLINQFVRREWKISIVTRRPHRHRDLQVFPDLRLIKSDNLTSDAINKIVSSGDTVINLIGILNESKNASFEETHTKLPDKIAQSCLQKQARRFIHISATGAAIEAPSAYLKSKALGENAVLSAGDQGLDCAIIRPSVIFGPDDSFTCRFANLLKLSKVFFPLACPKAVLHPVYINDVVQCIVHAAIQPEFDCRACDVIGPESFTLYEIVSLIDRLVGSRRRIIGLNDSLSMLMAQFMKFAPGKPITPDNVRSLQVSNEIDSDIPLPYGIQYSSLEATAKAWLSPQRDRFDAYRAEARR